MQKFNVLLLCTHNVHDTYLLRNVVGCLALAGHSLDMDVSFALSSLPELQQQLDFFPFILHTCWELLQSYSCNIFQEVNSGQNPRKRTAQKLPTDSLFYCFWQSVVKCVVATKGASSSITHFILGSRRINPSRALAGIKLKHKSRFVKEMY